MPPTEIISTSLKVEEDSLRVKVMVAVSPIRKVVLFEAMVIVGEVVSTVMENVLEAVLGLPAVSVKVLTKTLIVAGVVLLLVGVKVAV